MKNSGLRKPIYLIEFYKTQDNEKIKEDTLLQAVMNTQVLYTLIQTMADTTMISEILMEASLLVSNAAKNLLQLWDIL